VAEGRAEGVGIAFHGGETQDTRVLLNRRKPIGEAETWLLGELKAAQALAGRADSSRQAWLTQLTTLDPRPTVDSTMRLVERLKTARPTDLALINDARRQLDAVTRLQQGVTGLERSVRAGADSLGASVRALDAARQRDYAFARSLVQLPSFDAPNLAAALFGSADPAVPARALLGPAGAAVFAAGAAAPRDPGAQACPTRRHRRAVPPRARLAGVPAARGRAVVHAGA